MKDIHSCSYYCNRPECVLAQRNELRDKLAQQSEPEPEPVAWMESPHGAIRANPLYRHVFPSQLLHWQVPLYTAPPTRRPLTPVQEAAPDMLEALDKIACFAPGYGDACEIIAKVARAAIAKTTGGNDE
ncbi:MAG: hypothetical protein ACK5XV_05175 [Flavobacteriales bacterium]|jgi:hypothetical protein